MIDIDINFLLCKVARIRLQSSANGTTWLTRLGTVGLLTATCTIAVSASKVFMTMQSMRMRVRILSSKDEDDQCDDKVDTRRV